MKSKEWIKIVSRLVLVGLYAIVGIQMHVKALAYNFTITDAIASIAWYFLLANWRLIR